MSSSWNDTPLLWAPLRSLTERCQTTRMFQQVPRYWNPAKSSIEPGCTTGELLFATGLQTLAELMRSVSSWELAVALAPDEARPAYLGVAGMSQSIQKSAGPLLLTSVVMVAGPVGWLALGGVVASLSALQSRCCRRTLYRCA